MVGGLAHHQAHELVGHHDHLLHGAPPECRLDPRIPESTLPGFGLTEPEAGSDAGATRTTARLDGEEWVIDGSKQFITNSGTPITRFVTVTAVAIQL